MRGQDTTENPFSLLANETRLGVVEALGDSADGGGYPTRSYSAVRAALGDVDAGRLNYHLRKLRGRFVERCDDGYRLTAAGVRVYQALRSGYLENERPTLSPTDLDDECDVCAEPVTVSYERGVFYVRCEACETLYQRYPISPNAVDVSNAEELVTVGLLKAHVDTRSMLDGHCPYCSGRVERGLSTDTHGERRNNETERV
ncbi:DUF7351 domain-containing protein, partial [Halomarina oriensis]|nr:hypothetical protein [Halomarina oriensis]